MLSRHPEKCLEIGHGTKGSVLPQVRVALEGFPLQRASLAPDGANETEGNEDDHGGSPEGRDWATSAASEIGSVKE